MFLRWHRSPSSLRLQKGGPIHKAAESIAVEPDALTLGDAMRFPLQGRLSVAGAGWKVCTTGSPHPQLPFPGRHFPDTSKRGVAKSGAPNRFDINESDANHRPASRIDPSNRCFCSARPPAIRD